MRPRHAEAVTAAARRASSSLKGSQWVFRLHCGCSGCTVIVPSVPSELYLLLLPVLYAVIRTILLSAIVTSRACVPSGMRVFIVRCVCPLRGCSGCTVMTSCSRCASVVELYLLNFGVCHPNELLLGSDFQRRFQYFYYSLFTVCLLTISILYALIYCSVLARRSRRHKQKTASLAAMTSSLRPATVFDLQPDNCEVITMTALKVPTDIEARKTRHRRHVSSINAEPSKVFRLSVVGKR